MLGQKGDPTNTGQSNVAPETKEMEMNDFASAYPGVVGSRSGTIFTSMDRGGIIQADPRYLELTPETIKVGDVPGLLDEYKRLAALVAELSRK